MGQLPTGGTIRTKDTEYGKEHDLYPRQNFAAVDFVCAAGAVCPVFAGYVRRGGPVDCGQVCSIGGCFGGIHRLADHDDADKPGQQLCHGHHDFAGPADRLRRKEERRPHGWHSDASHSPQKVELQEPVRYYEAAEPSTRAVVGGSDFLQAVSNVDTTAALNVLDELMSALYVANPKVYNGVMRKLERLRNE